MVERGELGEDEDDAVGAGEDGAVAGPRGSELGEEPVGSGQGVTYDERFRVFVFGDGGEEGGIGP